MRFSTSHHSAPARQSIRPAPIVLSAITVPLAQLLGRQGIPQWPVALQLLGRHTSVSIRCIGTRAAIPGSVSQLALPAQMPIIKDSVVLNEVEKELLDTLLEAAKAANTGTVIRCAGGWVRDKLLGKESNDIDIALDNVMGKEFADTVNEYLKSQGKEVRNAAVIQSNPDQSKHLETARMKINGLWIDLVNLRSETYAQDSRIPTMEFGTAEQDALRRDFTINALFYNVNTQSVEDLTGKGLEDLRAGIIRTPLPPQETFLDDPLRVLRAVRFGTRFGFQLEPTILEAAASEPVLTALSNKVSKERIGTELDGMFNGQSPSAAVRLLHQLSLFPIVFALPPTVTVGPEYGSQCIACMEAAEAALNIELEVEERRFYLLAALLLPLRLCSAPSGAKGKAAPAATHVVRESIKWRAKDADVTVLLHETAPELLKVYQQLVTSGLSIGAGAVHEDTPAPLRVALGLAIRKLKQHWRLGMMLAPLLATKAAKPLGVDQAAARQAQIACTLPAITSQGSESELELLRNQEVASTLLAAASACGLENCWQWKPLVDGKQVMTLLRLQKAGPELGKALAAAMEWQLANPQGSLELCQQHVKQWHNSSK